MKTDLFQLDKLGVLTRLSAVIVITGVAAVGQSPMQPAVTIMQQTAYHEPKYSCEEDTQTYDGSMSRCCRSETSRPESNQPRCYLFLPNALTEVAVGDFVYQVTLTNKGNKTIRSVDWKYIFIDPDTQEEVSVHRFRTEERIPPRKRKTIVESSPSAPTRVISVKALVERRSKPFVEKVIITRVNYTDGSVWGQREISQ
jgi:hypothetical protein